MHEVKQESYLDAASFSAVTSQNNLSPEDLQDEIGVGLVVRVSLPSPLFFF